MRLSVATLACLLVASPALAADSIADQAHAAYATFTGGLTQAQFLGAQYSRSALSDVDGTWAKLSGADNKTGVESYGADTDKACKAGLAPTLASPDPMTLAVTTRTPLGSVTQTYSFIGGTTFGEHVDVINYLNAIGLGLDKTSDAAATQRALALSIVNGIVQIYRPSPDILVVTRDRGFPLVLARCPKA